jgi:hypothetical protein
LFGLASFPEVFPNVPCLKRHEINGTSYAIKKIRGKIKTPGSPLESGIAITDEKARRAKTARVAGLEREDEALSTLRAFFKIIGQPICHRFFASSSCVQPRRTRRL